MKMNVLQKSSLPVVVATVVTSVLILLTGTSVAEVNNADASVTTTVNESEKAINVGSTTNETVANKPNPLLTTSNTLKKQGANQIPPPPGPFFGNAAIKEAQERVLISPKQPVVPSTPISHKFVATPPEQTKAPEVKKPLIDTPSAAFKPKQPSFKPEMPSMGSNTASVIAPAIPKNTLLAPKLEMPKLKKPSLEPSLSKPAPMVEAPVHSKPRIQKQIGKAPAMNQQPIWMQKVPIEPALINKPPNMPSNGSLPINTLNNEQKDMNLSQKYMFMPAPMFAPNYSYPQMPMYGGGYYYSPTPQQFMLPPMMNYGAQMNQQQQQYIGKETSK